MLRPKGRRQTSWAAVRGGVREAHRAERDARPPHPLLQVLQADWLRESANQMAYFNKAVFATEDARRIGKLHTYLPGAALVGAALRCAALQLCDWLAGFQTCFAQRQRLGPVDRKGRNGRRLETFARSRESKS